MIRDAIKRKAEAERVMSGVGEPEFQNLFEPPYAATRCLEAFRGCFEIKIAPEPRRGKRYPAPEAANVAKYKRRTVFIQSSGVVRSMICIQEDFFELFRG